MERFAHYPPHQLPIYATSSFVLDDLEHGIDIFSGKAQGHTYSRYGNPTIDAVAAKIAALETHGLDQTASALLTSSGMSAIATLAMALLRPGDKLLHAAITGGTTELFSQIMAPLGIESIFIDLGNIRRVRSRDGLQPRYTHGLHGNTCQSYDGLCEHSRTGRTGQTTRSLQRYRQYVLYAVPATALSLWRRFLWYILLPSSSTAAAIRLRVSSSASTRS